jgi:tRNA A58 N-methylase Trm61
MVAVRFPPPVPRFGYVGWWNWIILSLKSELIIRNLDLQPGDDHLDIGCGPGRLTIPVAQQVGPQGAVVAI